MTDGFLEYTQFTQRLRAARPGLLHFIIQRKEKPSAHQIHLCVSDSEYPCVWVSLPFDSSEAGLSRVLRHVPA